MNIEAESMDLMILRKEFIIFILAIVFLFNLIVQSGELADYFFHINNIVYIVALLILRLKLDKNFLFACIMYFVCFHQYGSNPYSDDFTSYQSGFYKFIVFLLFISTMERLYVYGGFFYLLLILSVLLQLIFGENFRTEYIFNDFLFYLAVLPLLFFSNSNKKKYIDKNYCLECLFLFSLYIPIICIFIYIFDYGSALYGSYYFFYGHVISFVLLFSFFYYITNFRKKSLLFLPIVLVNLIVILQSLQSAYFLIFLCALFLMVVRKISLKYFAYIFLSILLLIYIQSFLPEGSWVALKVGQIIRIGSLTNLESLSNINSLAIRVYEIINIYKSSEFFEVFFGRGVGAIYRDVENLFSSNILHSASFPEKELLNGEFHLIHETFVRLFFHTGLIGFIVFHVIVYFKTKGLKEFSEIFLFSFFLFLWLSSIQTVFFLSMLLFVVAHNNDYKLGSSNE